MAAGVMVWAMLVGSRLMVVVIMVSRGRLMLSSVCQIVITIFSVLEYTEVFCGKHVAEHWCHSGLKSLKVLTFLESSQTPLRAMARRRIATQAAQLSRVPL